MIIKDISLYFKRIKKRYGKYLLKIKCLIFLKIKNPKKAEEDTKKKKKMKEKDY